VEFSYALSIPITPLSSPPPATNLPACLQHRLFLATCLAPRLACGNGLPFSCAPACAAPALRCNHAYRAYALITLLTRCCMRASLFLSLRHCAHAAAHAFSRTRLYAYTHALHHLHTRIAPPPRARARRRSSIAAWVPVPLRCRSMAHRSSHLHPSRCVLLLLRATYCLLALPLASPAHSRISLYRCLPALPAQQQAAA